MAVGRGSTAAGGSRRTAREWHLFTGTRIGRHDNRRWVAVDAEEDWGRSICSSSILDVDLPTGKYNDRQPVNIGNHFVAVNPYYALTYERKKLEFSTRLHYLWNSTNNDPFVGFGIRSMQPGQAFFVNYATSYELWKNVRLGFNGYWLQQLTDHQINGSNVRNSKERTVGLGPGIQLGSGPVWFRLNGYVERMFTIVQVESW